MANKHPDVAALWIAVLSLVLSVGAFGFSIFVFRVGRAESLSVEASLAFGRDELRCLPSVGDPVGLVQAPCGVTISNNSDRTVSIVSYAVYETDSTGRQATYTSITSAITDNQGVPISVPFSFAAAHRRHPVDRGGGQLRAAPRGGHVPPPADLSHLTFTCPGCHHPDHSATIYCGEAAGQACLWRNSTSVAAARRSTSSCALAR